MGSSDECYLDTSALIGALDRTDSYHPVYRRLFASFPPLAVSALVVSEAHDRYLRRYGQYSAQRVLSFVKALTPLSILSFGADELQRIAPLLIKFGDQELTMADAHGLLIMRERRVRACWSTNRHLRLTGVRLVN